jgi:putative hydrolase of HD superfamily
MTKAQQIIEFMNITEGLKRELRHSWLSDGRRESVAEHVWSMSLLALVLFDEVQIKVDRLRVLKMIIIHDLVEIYAGDMPSFEAAAGGQEQKEKDEKKALDDLMEKLHNQELAKEIKDLWYEFEDRETPEARFAQACDKAEAIIQHNNAGIETFSQGDYDINPYYKDDRFDFDPFIREFKDEIDKQTMEKIEGEGDISRVSEEHKKMWDEQNED